MWDTLTYPHACYVRRMSVLILLVLEEEKNSPDYYSFDGYESLWIYNLKTFN